MALEDDYTQALYNSYVADIDAMNSLIKALKGVVDVSDWDALDSNVDKENIIHAVVKDVNSFAFWGALNSAVISPYNMAWPRTGANYQNGVAIADAEIPIFILDYISRRAIERLEYDENTAVFPATAQNVKKQTVGSLSQEFFSPSDVDTNVVELNDMPSYECIKPYVSASSNDNFRFLIRA